MTPHFATLYYDRYSGRIETERTFAAGFLRWSYNSALGRLCTRWILSQRIVSRLCGVLARTRVSRRLIGSFVRHAEIDPATIGRPPNRYDSFLDFFTRELPGDQKPTAGPHGACLAPVSGRVLVLERLDLERSFRVKRSLFNLQRLVSDAALARRYAGGTAIICRLALADYHRVHFPVAGIPGPARAIGGRLYAGGPYARRWLVPFYTDNVRMVTPIQSERFGLVTMVEIGAFTVGSIRQRYRAGVRVSRGSMKAQFELGGSTVVILFEPGAVRIDADLLQHSREGLETRIRCGDSLGWTAIMRTRLSSGDLECAA
jgi:phosphatidylserine decarboxylase